MEYVVYVKTNSNNHITAINSSAFLSDIAGWVEIDAGYGDKYHHAQGNYLSKSIITEDGAYRYKLIKNKAIECDEQEIAEQLAKQEYEPSALEIMDAKITYIAMMTNLTEIL